MFICKMFIGSFISLSESDLLNIINIMIKKGNLPFYSYIYKKKCGHLVIKTFKTKSTDSGLKYHKWFFNLLNEILHILSSILFYSYKVFIINLRSYKVRSKLMFHQTLLQYIIQRTKILKCYIALSLLFRLI